MIKYIFYNLFSITQWLINYNNFVVVLSFLSLVIFCLATEVHLLLDLTVFFFFCSMSFLRASEKRQELNEKRKQLEETRRDKPQEKEVVCTGVVVSCMTAKLKLAYRN